MKPRAGPESEDALKLQIPIQPIHSRLAMFLHDIRGDQLRRIRIMKSAEIRLHFQQVSCPFQSHAMNEALA